MEIEIVEINKLKVRIIKYGEISKPIIIGLHGLGGSAYTFHEISEKLTKYCLICIDLPGHGKSEDLPTLFEPNYLVKWLDEIIMYLKINSFYILAHSWGATVAMHYAATHSSKVKKMMLLDGGYHNLEFSYKYFTELYKQEKLSYQPFTCFEDEVAYYIQDFDDYSFDSFDKAVTTQLNNHTRKNDSKRLMIEDLIVEEDGVYKWHANGKTARKALQMQYDSQTNIIFSNITSEVMVIYGDLPKVYFECRKQQLLAFKDKIDVTIKLYEQTGHMIHYDQPDTVTKDICSFFTNK